MSDLLAELRTRAEKAEVRVAELEAVFQRRWKATIRGIQKWRAQVPAARDLEWPDHADLVVFLLEQMHRMEWKLEQMECGHPVACMRYEPSPEHDAYCGWCEAEREAERQHAIRLEEEGQADQDAMDAQESRDAIVGCLTDEVDRLKTAITTFLAATGHDLCFENRLRLAAAVGGEPDYPILVPEQEFALGCIKYRQQLYGPDGPGSETEVWEREVARLKADLDGREKADQQAIAMWREDAIGQTVDVPPHDTLVRYLLDRIAIAESFGDEAEAKVAILQKELDGINNWVNTEIQAKTESLQKAFVCEAEWRMDAEIRLLDGLDAYLALLQLWDDAESRYIDLRSSTTEVDHKNLAVERERLRAKFPVVRPGLRATV